MSVSFTTSSHSHIQESFTDSQKSSKLVSCLTFGNVESASNARIVDSHKIARKQDYSLIEKDGQIAIEFSLDERNLNDQLKIFVSHEGLLRMKLNGRTFFSGDRSEEKLPLASLIRNRIIHPGINTLLLEPVDSLLKMEKIEILEERAIS